MTDHIKKLERKLVRLQIICTLMVFATGMVLLSGFVSQDKKRFDQIDVERINIIEKDGTLRMTISNKERSPEPLFKGKPFGLKGGNRTGLIFFNEEETEVGGLIFSGKTNANGKYSASGHLSFDQHNQNQTLYLSYGDQNGNRKTGLNIDDWQDSPAFSEWNQQYHQAAKITNEEERNKKIKQLIEPRPGEPAFAKRVFVGRDEQKKATVMLADRAGKPRLRLSVDTAGVAKIDFLDEKGNVTYSLPDSADQRIK
ncbi:hypothetical protein [Chryseobacterium kwangjuense]|uniref:Uncharacterized protein n=1 Tax=Chryseobacterium kwangjuense TaxID=267125 RepID=A0A135WHF9_9FLAO|nr:hypothetical protein [Chryseobacterium kwangjuense]KXH84351.1 hypothetical protein AU378_00905 [Chryseobacterium kwangjuense]